MATVKVAVRVRPFNQREIDNDCKAIIQMDGKATKIINTKIPEIVQGGDVGRERKKEFFFDFSHWSFNSKDEHFASQEQVYKDLGTEVVQSAFEGYNACVFAYGQTGSGKTYTMMGTPESVGLIPRICQNLFDQMKRSGNAGTTYRTEVSYLEIYNEKVKDLLYPNHRNENLRVREHPTLGPYVQNLSKHLVMDYDDIRDWILKGNSIRTTASTNMNDTSSRSHAIFTITFTQAKFSQEMPSETVSKINLVDLAGSERADSSGATGQRLIEGGHINKSLVTLGTVISALADMSSGNNRSRQIFVPYRDSVLTWLLKDSLGGNSKTIMIAAISPADINYGETLSTLRYANRAKNIINKPTINEDPNVKIIRELRAEINRLKNMLSSNSQNGNSSLIVELRANEEREKVLTEKWTEQWRETKKILQEQQTLALRKSGVGVVLDSDMPHLVGIDDSIYSSGMTFYPLKEGSTYIGAENASPSPEIVISEVADMSPHPCSIELTDGKALLNPLENSSCYILVDTNTNLVEQPTQLTHGCVIVVGRNMFRYNDPPEAAKLRKDKSNRSDFNLSRLSFLSQSSPDLRRSLNRSNNTPPTKYKDTDTELQPSSFNDSLTPPLRNRTKSKRQRLDFQSKKNSFSSEKSNKEPENCQMSESNLHNTEPVDGENNPNILNCDRTPSCNVMESNLSPGSETSFHVAVQRSNSITSTPNIPDGSVIRKCKSEFDVSYDAETGVNSCDNADRSSNLQVNSDAARLTCIQRYLEHMYRDIGENSNDSDRQKLEKLKRHFSRIEKELKSAQENNLNNESSENGFTTNERPVVSHQHNRVFRQSLSIPADFHPISLDSDHQDDDDDRRSTRSYCSSPAKSSRSSFSFDGLNLEVLENNGIYISVPSFILRGSNSTAHYEYEVMINCRSETWTIFRRYKRFEILHKLMKQRYPDMMKTLRLPSRWYFWQSSDELAEKRRQHLQMYLRDLLTKCLSTKECELYAYLESLNRQLICDYIPFFRKGDFENTKYGTS